MRRGLSPSDWTVMWDGRNGTVSCPYYAARFTAFRTGYIKLWWIAGPRKQPQAIDLAAKEAVARAVKG
jgi:hypothetical protein